MALKGYNRNLTKPRGNAGQVLTTPLQPSVASKLAMAGRCNFAKAEAEVVGESGDQGQA